jgi:hypothetical protein
MTNKNKIIVAIIAFCLILIIIFFVFFTKNNTTNEQSSDNSSVSNTSVSTFGQTSSGTTQNTNFPSSTSVTKTEWIQPNTNFETINNPDDKTEIQNAFNKFLLTSPGKFKWTNLVGANKKSISLDDFSQSVGLNVKLEIKNLLDTSRFDLFSCSVNSENKKLGIALNFKLLPDYKGNLYKDELNIMKDWEVTLFQDTRTVIFPDINFTPQQLDQKPAFKNGQYRYAEISLPDDKKGSLNYDVIDDYLVISNSMDCLSSASDEIIAPSD